MTMNNEKSSLRNTISGVFLGPIGRPTLFKFYSLNNFLFFILISSVHDFAMNDSLSNNPATVDSLKQKELKPKIASKWVHEN